MLDFRNLIDTLRYMATLTPSTKSYWLLLNFFLVKLDFPSTKGCMQKLLHNTPNRMRGKY